MVHDGPSRAAAVTSPAVSVFPGIRGRRPGCSTALTCGVVRLPSACSSSRSARVPTLTSHCTVIHARTQRPHRGADTSADAREAVSTQQASHPTRGGTGVEAVTDGLLGLRAGPQHGAPIQLLPPVPVPQLDSAPLPVLRWHSREPLLTCVTLANADIILTMLMGLYSPGHTETRNSHITGCEFPQRRSFS
jgi:hypothetical protein